MQWILHYIQYTCKYNVAAYWNSAAIFISSEYLLGISMSLLVDCMANGKSTLTDNVEDDVSIQRTTSAKREWEQRLNINKNNKYNNYL